MTYLVGKFRGKDEETVDYTPRPRAFQGAPDLFDNGGLPVEPPVIG